MAPPDDPRSHDERRPPRRPLLERAVIAAVIAHFLGAIALWMLLRLVAERWWPATALLYLPRWPWALPAVPLALLAWFCWRRGVWLALAAAAIVLGPVCGLRLGLAGGAAGPDSQPIRVVTLNIQNGKPNLAACLGEIERFDADIVMCQEVDSAQPELVESVRSIGLRHSRHDSHLWIASRWPLEHLRTVESQATYRDICATYRTRLPDGTVLHLANVHLATARHGLTKLRLRSPITGVGLDELHAHQTERLAEIDELQATLDALPAPSLVGGDFNMPTDSPGFAPLLRTHRSVFDAVGRGYGYSVPNDAGGWPRGLCWLRVDHLLVSTGVTPLAAQVGDSVGSDHRAMLGRVAVAPRRQAEVVVGEKVAPRPPSRR